MHYLMHILVVTVLIQITCACYITNCPIGGKRNLRYGNNPTPHQVSHRPHLVRIKVSISL